MNFFNHSYFIFDTDNSAPLYAILGKRSKSAFIGLWSVRTLNRLQRYANRINAPVNVLSRYGSLLFTLQPEKGATDE